ncbi:MAG: hypothetical protein EHM24_18875 [Acidobacteria bacterium]|nr:MAG: hypothetical protein EHM24_18875 [Acidobacteriota bacterium]
MTDKKSWGSTVLGWFIVQDEEQAGASAAGAGDGGSPEADAAVIAAAAAESPVPDVFQTAPPTPVGGRVEFDAVFEAAGIDAGERERVDKAQQLLSSLPAETPVPVKKQIVEASLKAFGVPIDNIIEAGVAEIQALEGYIRKNAADTQALLEESTRRIAQLEEEARKVRAGMEGRIQQQQGIAASCNGRKLDVQKVLEFFGQEAVARVVHASPRLQEPPAPGAGA